MRCACHQPTMDGAADESSGQGSWWLAERKTLQENPQKNPCSSIPANMRMACCQAQPAAPQGCKVYHCTHLHYQRLERRRLQRPCACRLPPRHRSKGACGEAVRLRWACRPALGKQAAQGSALGSRCAGSICRGQPKAAYILVCSCMYPPPCTLDWCFHFAVPCAL